EAFGVEKAEKILPMMNDKPPFTIRVNVLKTGREALRQALLEKGITSEMGSCDASALKLLDVGAFESHVQKDNLFTEGFFTIQDQGAMVAARLLAPEPGERVLDMCAAPGGKTTHLAELMGNTGEIIARDVFASRITLIEDTAKRLGITIIKTEEKDGSIFDEAEQNTYDRILLDAPCTGLGIIRRKPEIRYGMGKKDRQAIVKLQAKLLDHAVAYLKPGGTMVYATCTVNPDENEKQIVKLLEKYPFMSVHHEVGCDGRLHTTPLDDGCDGRLHTTPLDDGCDGFFMCKLVKDHGVN
ncbi:MAG: 16S rRNA (cytosine(967)-C(5))-methyltransferase RsmB, partial [Eubacterium sp.]